jgi:hypothetical protein
MRRMGLILLILFFFAGICDGEEEVIYKITILGNVKIEEGVIRGAVKRSISNRPQGVRRLSTSLQKKPPSRKC